MKTAAQNLVATRAAEKLRARADASLERRVEPQPCPAETRSADLRSNDYLGLASHPRLIAAGQQALAKWGCSSSASPLLGGCKEIHAELEHALARWAGFAHGLVWNTGFSANHAVLSTLPQTGDLVLADRLAHHSMLAGIVASGARLVRFPHNDLGALRRLLERESRPDRTIFVATESVYSMDGDIADLRGLAALREEFGFFWVLDEAHALGWYGPAGAGLSARENVADQVDLLVGTLGKGLGSMGAFTLFHDPTLRQYLVNFAGDFIYSTYLAPACAAVALEALCVVSEIDAEEQAAWHALSVEWRSALRTSSFRVPEGDSPIVPVLVGDAGRAMACSEKLRKAGFSVGAVRPPTVPAGQARLRLSLRRGLPLAMAGEIARLLSEEVRQ